MTMNDRVTSDQDKDKRMEICNIGMVIDKSYQISEQGELRKEIV